MSNRSLRKRLEETLSEGQGKQLLWLLVIIVIAILLCWGVIAIIFHDGSLEWQDLLALFLDPGSFGGAGTHDLFRIVVALLGMFLFSALLISLVSNMFENMAESFKKGFSRYSHKDHILILGGGHQLTSMIFALTHDNSPYKDEDIVVVTSQPVDELRSKVLALPFLSGGKEMILRKRITLYYGDRDNESTLTKKDLAKNAKVIYIIGEDNEIDHDSISIRCCKRLKDICKDTGKGAIYCYLILQDSASIDVYKYTKDAETVLGSDLKVDVIDANEYIAEQVLVADHDNIDIVVYPGIDYRDIVLDEGGFKTIEGIRAIDDKYVHFVVAGTSGMARAMGLTAAHNCHFPNFENGKRRTVITFVDTDMKEKMDAFVASFSNLFNLSHYSFLRFDDDGHPLVSSYVPDERYGDFLDIEWQFIDANLNTPGMRVLLEKWADDQKQSLSLAICMEDQGDNTAAALHLPNAIYRKGCPIFVHQQDYGDVLSLAKNLKFFGNIHPFGMASSVQDDPLFLSRSEKGQRVNFIYNQKYGKPKFNDEKTAWFSIPEAHKFSSIYSANSMYFKERSFGLDERQGAAIYDVEHRRWMTSALILGYTPVESASRSEWKARRLSTATEEDAKEQYNALKDAFIHMDITPYDDLIPTEKDKDKIIIDKLSFILRGK